MLLIESLSSVYRVVTLCLNNIVGICLSSCKLAKVLLFLSKLSCLVCCVDSLIDLAIFDAQFSFNLIFVQNDAMRC